MSNSSPEELYRAVARAAGVPRSLTLELTTKCQLSCQHCYNFDRSIEHRTTSLELDTLKKILREAAELGVLRVELTGGESTLHPAIDDVITEAKALKFWTILKTHGALSSGRFQKLCSAGIDELSISVYGDERCHDAFTGVRGSWQKTQATIEASLKAGLRTDVSLIMHAGNVESIFGLQDAYVALGAIARVSTTIHPRHVGGDVAPEIKLSQEQWQSFYDQLYQRETPNLELFSPGCTREFKCGCALDSFAVASNGDVYPCIGVPWTAGSVFESSLKSIWDESDVFQQIRSLRSEHFATCHDCSLKQYCERVTPGAYLASGAYTGFDPNQCVQAQAHFDWVQASTISEG